jgi:hypothetical protein
MSRMIVLGALALAGCFSPSYHSGGLVCGPGSQPCPDGYHCAVDHFCWKNGEDPAADLATADLSKPPADLSMPTPDLSTPTADLSTTPTDLSPSPGDLATRPDLAGFDGGHAVRAITAACGGGVKAAGSTHSVTLSVGQKSSGVAVGTARRLQLGALRGAQPK